MMLVVNLNETPRYFEMKKNAMRTAGESENATQRIFLSARSENFLTSIGQMR